MKLAVGGIVFIGCPECGHAMHSKSGLPNSDKAEVWCVNYSCEGKDKSYFVKLPKYELFEEGEE